MPEPQPSALESSLEALTSKIDDWDPDAGHGVDEILHALKELQLRFDPRKDRLSSALCVTSMKLLEEIGHGDKLGK